MLGQMAVASQNRYLVKSLVHATRILEAFQSPGDILRLRDVYGVTSMLATQRLQDGFALANFRFDAEAKKVVHTASNGNAAAGARLAATRFLVLREGGVYFEGGQEELASSKDAYLKKFLV